MEKEDANTRLLRRSNEESNRITKEALQTAVVLLLRGNKYEKISITDITKKAGVSRSAFYRNYGSKEELVKDACKAIYEGLKKSVSSEGYTHDKSAWYVKFFSTIKSNSEYFQIYLDTGLPIENGYVLNDVFPPKSRIAHYENVAKEGAFLNILVDWFNNGMKEAPEEMAKICMRLLNR